MTVDLDIETHYTTRHDEAARLSSTLKGRLEAIRVRDLLGRYLPEPPATVADIGGGPGIHASWLAEQGYSVELLDPVERHIEQATAAGITAVQGDARRLPWENEYFDAVLLAGPMYHLPEAADRRLALREAIRVLRPGGFIAVIAINRAANLIGSTLANKLLQRQGIVTDILETGFSPDNERMAQTTYHTVTQLRTELVSAGLRSVTVHGLTGPGGWLTVTIDAHYGGGLGKEPDDRCGGVAEDSSDRGGGVAEELDAVLPASLCEPDPLQTALECSRLADRFPELVPSSSLLFAVGQRV
ncbi:methyltransferase family protein [Kribbella sp. VKM Ac-2527]|uniref:Methyltransferase family protein n=1 Tax=Kribbella caucasensis TaxID=2512215 RepID=A0A4V3CB57_9ACTN|nr:class I SAM-dependent methyltransferase [Kribbella sp. VKM Ac-2527]TDO54560.1 methyltransferase family protein [Kribbella sp. VKM Ac-2527]